MSTTKNIKNKGLAGKLLATVATAIVAIAGITTAIIVLANSPKDATIEYSDGEHSAKITVYGDNYNMETGQGEVTEEDITGDIPTVEAVDPQTPAEADDSDTEATTQDVTKRLENGEEVGLGSTIDLSFINLATPTAFKDSTLGLCINTDFAYGAQCYDLADAFWQKAYNRRATTCGTGAAKGMIANGCWQKNAGNDMEYIANWKDIQPGDWLFFSTGQWGHVGMAQDYPNGNYIVLLGQNQGGRSCPGGGAAASLINISNRDFIGALRPKMYIKKPAPAPAPTPVYRDESTITSYRVKKGDTLGKIALKMGWYKGVKGLYGDTGYTQKLAEANGIKFRGLIYPGQVIQRVK